MLSDNQGVRHVLRERFPYPKTIDRKRVVLSCLRYPSAQSRCEIYGLRRPSLPDSPNLGKDHDCPYGNKDASTYRLVRGGGG
ncbi:hypothetical protein N8I81_06155 [Bacteroides xylanisolvens]|nr:hypothetical protein [Bacteroides xylanisolvens]MDE5404896.1 hypothetical protein [Bacteroides xylanisolvens]